MQDEGQHKNEELQRFVEQEEPWTEEIILKTLRSRYLRSAYAATATEVQLRLTLESIRAVKKFDRSTTIFSCALLLVTLAQLGLAIWLPHSR
jgi:hypothetical protein